MVGGALEGAYQGSYKLAPIDYQIAVVCQHVFDEQKAVLSPGPSSLRAVESRQALAYATALERKLMLNHKRLLQESNLLGE